MVKLLFAFAFLYCIYFMIKEIKIFISISQELDEIVESIEKEEIETKKEEVRSCTLNMRGKRALNKVYNDVLEDEIDAVLNSKGEKNNDE